MNDDGRNVEEDAGNLVRMLLELFSGQNTIKDNIGLWERSRLHFPRLD